MESRRDKDPAFEPLREAGQGESEGFEEAEAELERNAEDAYDSNPIERIMRDRIEEDPDVERGTAEYGDADEIDSTQDDSES
ncbi:MAG TPA: hypothetical protein VGO97_04595 [Solirubrobacterales bacterium]|jgi:hypothetical protein|nr:hypothetical protein [Solirubrobacterales bacterium]